MTKPRARILVVNPNMSDAVTSTYVRAATDSAPDGVDLVGVTGTFGAKIVTIEAENVVAAYSALELVAKHVSGFDAVILAISFDSGLRALQSLLPVPVVGITEATLQAASQGGRRIGIIFFGEASRELYEGVIAGYGITPVGCLAIDFTSVEDYLTPDAKDDAVTDAIATLKAAGAEAIAICGTAIVGMAARLQLASDVPLYDGLCAVEKCLADVGQDTISERRCRSPVGPSQNLSPELSNLIAGTLTSQR